MEKDDPTEGEKRLSIAQKAKSRSRERIESNLRNIFLNLPPDVKRLVLRITPHFPERMANVREVTELSKVHPLIDRLIKRDPILWWNLFLNEGLLEDEEMSKLVVEEEDEEGKRRLQKDIDGDFDRAASSLRSEMAEKYAKRINDLSARDETTGTFKSTFWKRFFEYRFRKIRTPLIRRLETPDVVLERKDSKKSTSGMFAIHEELLITVGNPGTLLIWNWKDKTKSDPTGILLMKRRHTNVTSMEASKGFVACTVDVRMTSESRIPMMGKGFPFVYVWNLKTKQRVDVFEPNMTSDDMTSKRKGIATFKPFGTNSVVFLSDRTIAFGGTDFTRVIVRDFDENRNVSSFRSFRKESTDTLQVLSVGKNALLSIATSAQRSQAPDVMLSVFDEERPSNRSNLPIPLLDVEMEARFSLGFEGRLLLDTDNGIAVLGNVMLSYDFFSVVPMENGKIKFKFLTSIDSEWKESIESGELTEVGLASFSTDFFILGDLIIEVIYNADWIDEELYILTYDWKKDKEVHTIKRNVIPVKSHVNKEEQDTSLTKIRINGDGILFVGYGSISGTGIVEVYDLSLWIKKPPLLSKKMDDSFSERRKRIGVATKRKFKRSKQECSKFRTKYTRQKKS